MSYYKQGIASQKQELSISGDGDSDTGALVSFVKVSGMALIAMWILGHVPEVKAKPSTKKPWWKY